MSVTDIPPIISYPCDGNQQKFPFDYKIFTETDLSVYLVDRKTGNEHPLKYIRDYDVEPALNNGYEKGGSVITVKQYSNLYNIVIMRKLTSEQLIILQYNNPLPPEAVSGALDRTIMIIQEMQLYKKNSLHFPLDEIDSATELPHVFLRKNKLLGFDKNGDPTAITQQAFIYRGDYKEGVTYTTNDIIRDPDQSHIYIALKTFIASTIADDLEAGNIDYFLINYSGNAIWIDGLRVILSGIENGDVIMYENGVLVPRSAGGNVKTVNSVGPDAHGNVGLTTDNLPEGEMESRKYLTRNNCNTLGIVRVEDPEKALKHGFVPRAAADGTQIEDAYPIQQDDEECFVHTVKILGQNQTVFPSRYLPHLNIGRMWVQKVGEYDKEQRWWYQLAHREDFQSDAESGDLCYAIDEGLHDWELHHDPIHGGIQISHEYYHNDPWSIQYIDHHNETYALAKAEVSSGKHVIKARHVRGGYWLYVTEDYAGQGVFEINIKVHYDNIAEAQNIPIYSAELADIKKNTWLYQEIETPEPLQHYNQIDAIEIKANVVTRGHESSGNIFLDDITVEFNIAENETDDPIWSKNYCPAIAPAHKWDIFACQDIDKAKHPSHESAKDDGWLDYEIPIGIQYINGHTGLTVELETGDIDEGLGSHGKVHKWLNDSNLKSIASFIDLKQDVITNADKIKEIIINIADMATKTWIKEQGYLKKGTDLEEYISKNPTVVANDERSKANEENKLDKTKLAGGTVKYVLTKISDDDHDYTWVAAQSGLKVGDYRISSNSVKSCKATELSCNMGLIELDAEIFPELAKVYGVKEGTFNAAITAGDFVRNVGGNAEALNTHQSDALQDHEHSTFFVGRSGVNPFGTSKPSTAGDQGSSPDNNNWNVTSPASYTRNHIAEDKSGVAGLQRIENETRSVNTSKNFFEIVASTYNHEAYEAHKDKELPIVYGYDIFDNDREYKGYKTISPVNYIESTKDHIVYWYERVAEKNFTTEKPLEPKKGFAICRTKDNSKWEYIKDHRNETVYEKATGKTVKVNYLGKIKDEYTTVKPPEYVQFYKFANNQWILYESKKDDLIKVITERIKAETERAISESKWKIETEENEFKKEYEHLRFLDIEEAKNFIKELQNKSMEELIKLL